MTSSYRRQSRPYWNSNTPTVVNIYWSQQYSAYACKWQNTYHFKEMSPIINYFKAQPYGECIYDPDNKVWYFKEQYLKDVRSLIEAFGSTIFTVSFTEKPQQNHSFMASIIPIQTYLNQFKEMTNEDISNVEYRTAKKIYLKFCMKHHPDLNPEDHEISSVIMSKMNEIWTAIESNHFKTKKEPTYVNE